MSDERGWDTRSAMSDRVIKALRLLDACEAIESRAVHASPLDVRITEVRIGKVWLADADNVSVRNVTLADAITSLARGLFT